MNKRFTALTLPLLATALLTQGQSITTPANTPLSLSGDLSIPAGRGLQVGSATFLRLPAAGSRNIAIGVGAANSTSTGKENVMLGDSAGFANTTASGSVAVGHQAGFRVNGPNNVFLGRSAGFGASGSTANNNVAIGSFAGGGLTTGQYNLFMGNAAGQLTTVGQGNAFIGDGAGYNNLGGNFNLYLGQYAGFRGTSANFNVAIGQLAGVENTTGAYNVFIGQDAGVSNANPGLSYATAIGAGARIAVSNAVVLGRTTDNVGIGTTSPQARLHLVSGTANTSGLRLGNLTSASPATATNQTKFLSVDASGNVILASSNSSTREAAAASGWSLTGAGHLQNGNSGGVVIGPGIAKTPAGYRLYVADGILTEKVKVAIKDTGEWADYVFGKNYRLRPLNEVEQHIQQKGHLPGIPSAQQVVEEGVDLGKMNAKLLEKVEELTLYLIEQQKQIQQLKAENEAIRQQLKK